MARVAIPITVFKPDASNANAQIPANGASVTVRKRADNSLATVYTTETGGTTAANPLTTDAFGRVTAWVDRGNYKLSVTGSGITAYDEMFDAMPAADGAIDLLALASVIVPLGIILPYAGATAPAGGNWLLADGSSLLRAGTYAPLFAVIGTAFGAADGSHFNLPDLRGRVPLGAGTPVGAAGATAHTLGALAGEEKHTLTAGEMPSHGHGVTDPNHQHSYPNGEQTTNFTLVGLQLGASNISLPTSPTNTTTDFAGTGISIQSTGGGGAHNILPPHNVTNYIIRAV